MKWWQIGLGLAGLVGVPLFLGGRGSNWRSCSDVSAEDAARFHQLNKPFGEFEWDGTSYPDYGLPLTLAGEKYRRLKRLPMRPTPKSALPELSNVYQSAGALAAIKRASSMGLWSTPSRGAMVCSCVPSGVHPAWGAVLAAICDHESRWNPSAVGGEDCGLSQINIHTALGEYEWEVPAGTAVRMEPWLLLESATHLALARFMIAVWANKYAKHGMGVAGVLRRWGGGVQQLEPWSDYERTLVRIAKYCDALGVSNGD